MIKPEALIFPLVLLFAAAAGCAGNETKIETVAPAVDPAGEKTRYDQAASQWADAAVSHYSARIQYGAFSPLAGEWTIEVKNNVLIHWSFKNTSDDKQHRDAASRLTMENLFAIAKGSLDNAASKPFTIKASFDSRNGSVKDVAKIRNAAYKGRVPTDKTFRYTVTELTIMK